jgi:hypothetical protein
MKNYREVNKVEKELISMVCDRCHKTEDDVMELQEWLKLDFVGGFQSIFGDGNQYRLDLCQKCMKELFGTYVRYIGNIHIIE